MLLSCLNGIRPTISHPASRSAWPSSPRRFVAAASHLASPSDRRAGAPGSISPRSRGSRPGGFGRCAWSRSPGSSACFDCRLISRFPASRRRRAAAFPASERPDPGPERRDRSGQGVDTRSRRHSLVSPGACEDKTPRSYSPDAHHPGRRTSGGPNRAYESANTNAARANSAHRTRRAGVPTACGRRPQPGAGARSLASRPR